MQNAELTVGGGVVIATGTVVHLASDILKIKPTGSGAYFVEFRFVKDSANPDNRAVRNFNEGTGNIIECTNFDRLDSIPMTLRRPINVGSLSGNKLLLFFSITAVGSDPKVLQIAYTFYNGGPING